MRIITTILLSVAVLALAATCVGEIPPPMTASRVTVTALTKGPKFHWFGYYDKLQFDPSGRYVLGMEVDFEHRSPTKDDVIKIGMVDLKDSNKWIELGQSRAWCWQQGCMLQWRPGSKTEILWNDREGGRFVCHILDVKTRKKRTLKHAVYHGSPDGKWALGTDFARTNEMRPGYGYAGIPDPNAKVNAPKDSGVYRLNLDSGEYRFLVSVADIAKIRFGVNDAKDVKNKVYFNHIQWSPDGKRFIVFNRGRGVRTAVYTAAADGSDIRFLAKDSSHFEWRDPQHVLIWSRGAYRLYKDDGSGKNEVILRSVNGHNSYLPNRDWIVTDTYPLAKRREQMVYLYHIPSRGKIVIGRFHSPPKYTGEWRCDTHPRISPDGTKVVIDSPHGGSGRQMYMIDISKTAAARR